MVAVNRQLNPAVLIFTVMAVLIIFLTSLYSFLFFHVMAEIYIISVSFTIAALAWLTRKEADSYLATLGIGFFFIAAIDVLHLITYKGMDIIPGIDANIPTQLWIAEKYLQAFCLIAGFLLIGRRINEYRLGLLFFSFTVLAFGTIYLGVFPTCYVEGSGLTLFKIASEYAICGLFLLAIYLLHQRRQMLDRSIYQALMVALVLSILAELSFTNYLSVYGTFNLIGHILTLVAFGFIFLAVVYIGITRPMDTLFRSLSERELIYRTLSEKGHSYLALLDEKDRTVHLNAKLKSLMKKEDAELTGQDFPSLFTNGDPTKMRDALKELRSGMVESFEQKIMFNGVPHNILWRGGTSDLGDDQMIVLTGLDITEQENLRVKSEELNEAMELINRILIHDTVNQLTVISGNIELYKETGKEENLNRVEAAIKNMESLVQRMRKMMRAINDPLHLRPVEVRTVALRIAENHQSEKISISVVGECTALADESLENLVDNLVGNAIAHSGGDEIVITMHEKGSRCQVEVADNGNGLTDEMKSTIFQLGTKSGRSRGMGFGLFLVKRLVERFGGSILVKDREPKGIRFIIDLRNARP